MSLAAHMRASALLQHCIARGEGAYVIRKGDPVAGAILVKHIRPDRSAAIHARRYSLDGEAVWEIVMEGDDESPLDAYLDRRAQTDPDLWVIEVECRAIADALALI